jgi:DNA-binding NtrC family response regulator
MKILLVDDDRNYRAMLYEFLHAEGHDVMAVSDAVHAVALLSDNDHRINLVLLDLKMPRLGGDEIMAGFADWTCCNAQFIIISGSNEVQAYKDHSKVIGCLQKPFSFDDLKKAMTKCVVTKSKQKAPVAAAH